MLFKKVHHGDDQIATMQETTGGAKVTLPLLNIRTTALETQGQMGRALTSMNACLGTVHNLSESINTSPMIVKVKDC